VFDIELPLLPMFVPREDVIDCLVEDQPGAVVGVRAGRSAGRHPAPPQRRTTRCHRSFGMNSYEARLVETGLKAIWTPGVGTTLMGRRRSS
jgi:hypothetical protein